jgi:hypothetical protein
MLAVCLGCNHAPAAALGPPIGPYDEFRPASSPPVAAQLTMAGVSFPVTIRVAASPGGMLRITALQDSKPVDEELYHDDGATFSLARAAGENFEPPMPLLSFPMHIGDHWDWTGSTTMDTSAQAARASIHTAVSRTMIDGNPENSVEVDIDLEMGVNSASPMRRQLKFWFVKGKGIVRRSFGEESIREPLVSQRKGDPR